jgi:hypothetical protein
MAATFTHPLTGQQTSPSLRRVPSASKGAVWDLDSGARARAMWREK